MAQTAALAGTLPLLAQARAPAVTPLPDPPPLEWLLLEQPWPLAVALALAGVIGFTLLSRRGRPAAAMAAALACFAAAAGLWGLATSVATERERMAEATRQLVAAVATVDSAALDRLLADDARAFYFQAPRGLRKDDIIMRVEDTLGERGEYGIEEHRVLEVQATLDGPRVGRTQVHVRVTPERTNYPHFSWWRVDWRLEADGEWRVVSVQPIVIQGIPHPGP